MHKCVVEVLGRWLIVVLEYKMELITWTHAWSIEEDGSDGMPKPGCSRGKVMEPNTNFLLVNQSGLDLWVWPLGPRITSGLVAGLHLWAYWTPTGKLSDIPNWNSTLWVSRWTPNKMHFRAFSGFDKYRTACSHPSQDLGQHWRDYHACSCLPQLKTVPDSKKLTRSGLRAKDVKDEPADKWTSPKPRPPPPRPGRGKGTHMEATLGNESQLIPWDLVRYWLIGSFVVS